MRAICPPAFILFDLITLKHLARSRNYKSPIMKFLQPHVTHPLLLGSNIFLVEGVWSLLITEKKFEHNCMNCNLMESF
jgi:hypothetical protein